MGKYRLRLKKSAAKEIENLPKKDCARVLGAIQKLMDDPYGQNTQKLSGQEKYRIRYYYYCYDYYYCGAFRGNAFVDPILAFKPILLDHAAASSGLTCDIGQFDNEANNELYWAI